MINKGEKVLNPYWKKRNNNYRKQERFFNRVNLQIRATSVRVIKDGEQLGVMSADKAIKLAQEYNLDLIEINAKASPSICIITDLEKFKYEKSLKEKEQKKKQKVTVIKEVHLSPNISDHDIECKINQAKKFLESGKKVKLNLKFVKRELAHKDLGFTVVKNVIETLKEVSSVEQFPKMEGKDRIICILTPVATIPPK